MTLLQRDPIYDVWAKLRRAEDNLFEIALALGPVRCRELAGELRVRAIKDERFPRMSANQTAAANVLLSEAMRYERSDIVARASK